MYLVALFIYPMLTRNYPPVDYVSCTSNAVNVFARFTRSTQPGSITKLSSSSDIDDINSDSLHLDIWDHDDESSVLEAVSKLNEVRGVRGLGRFFKQVCQSARQSSQDDFLGCVTIPLQDIPSTGLEGWFKLEARSQRSSVQGRIRLKMWLSTREDRGTSEEDNWTELMQHESLYATFIDYELRNWNRESWTWSGDLPALALTILHQHSVQGDLTQLQTAAARFVAASKVYLRHPLDPRWMLSLLTDLEHAWLTDSLTREEEMWLAERFASMLGKDLSLCFFL